MPYAGPNDALYYEDVGHGHPIFFIPGFGGVGSFWSKQADILQESGSGLLRLISAAQAPAYAAGKNIHSIR